MKKILCTLALFVALCCPCTLYADQFEDDLYLTPERLFHIARSLNRNLVCYDVNLVEGKLDTHAPLNVYWLNREDRKGATNGLNFIQRKLAYGYKVVAEGGDNSTVTLTAYPARRLEICRMDGRYVCRTTIGGRPAILQFLYVKANEHNSLDVEYVELHGRTLDTQEEVVERINN